MLKQAGCCLAGVWVDGMDALSVKNATAFAKQYVLSNGPLLLEMVWTFSLHAHLPVLTPCDCLDGLLDLHGVSMMSTGEMDGRLDGWQKLA